MKCNITNKNVEEILSFGKMPIANGFLNEKDKSYEYFSLLKINIFSPFQCTP